MPCRGAEPKQLAFSAALGVTIGIFPICGKELLDLHFIPPISSQVACGSVSVCCQLFWCSWFIPTFILAAPKRRKGPSKKKEEKEKRKPLPWSTYKHDMQLLMSDSKISQVLNGSDAWILDRNFLAQITVLHYNKHHYIYCYPVICSSKHHHLSFVPSVIAGTTVILGGVAVAMLGSRCNAVTVMVLNLAATPIELRYTRSLSCCLIPHKISA